MDTGSPSPGRLAVLDQITAAVQALAGGTFEPMLPCESRSAAAALAALKGRVSTLEADYTSRVARFHAAGDTAAPTDVLVQGGRMSGKDAKRALRVADTLDAFPSFTPLLSDGVISTGHVDALAEVVTTMDASDLASWQAEPDRLLDAARTSSPEDFGRALKRRRVVEQAMAGVTAAEQEHKANRAMSGIKNGRWWFHLDADLEMGTRMETAIQAEMDAMRATGDLDALHPDQRTDIAHLRFYATQRILSRGFQAAGPNRSSGQVSEMTVTIDEKTLLSGVHEHTVCELGNGEPLPIATARRLACEAGIYPVVLSGAGVVLDQGREKRVANREQRRALRAMYRTCAVAGCTVPFIRCEVHHVIPWLPTGRTDIGNLVPLCLWHHHQVHDRQWTLTLDSERTLRMYLPDGTLHSENPLRPLAPGADRPAQPGGSPPDEPAGSGPARDAWP